MKTKNINHVKDARNASSRKNGFLPVILSGLAFISDMFYTLYCGWKFSLIVSVLITGLVVLLFTLGMWFAVEALCMLPHPTRNASPWRLCLSLLMLCCVSALAVFLFHRYSLF